MSLPLGKQQLYGPEPILHKTDRVQTIRRGSTLLSHIFGVHKKEKMLCLVGHDLARHGRYQNIGRKTVWT